MSDKIFNPIFEDLDKIYDDSCSIENRLYEFINKLSVTVADNTSFNNLKLQYDHYDLVKILKEHYYLILEFGKNVEFIEDLINILDETESSKDRYLIVKLIKSYMESIKSMYDYSVHNLETLRFSEYSNIKIYDEQLKKFLIDTSEFIKKTYEVLQTLY